MEETRVRSLGWKDPLKKEGSRNPLLEEKEDNFSAPLSPQDLVWVEKRVPGRLAPLQPGGGA